MASSNHREYSSRSVLASSLAEVFGRWPVWPWSVLGVIVACGLIGLAVAPLFAPSEGQPHPALRRAAVMGYGMAIGAFITVVPGLLSLQQRSRDLRQRPDHDVDWWPYQLLASALIDVPALRATPEDFGAAVDRTRVRSRELLAFQLWPVAVAAFVIPVLGLLSAWESGQTVIFTEEREPARVFPEIISQVSPPMISTIVVGLMVILLVVGIDQWTRSLLAGWADRVRFTDAESQQVQVRLEQTRDSRHADLAEVGMPVSTAASSTPPPVPPSPDAEDSGEPVEPQISVDKFEDLKDAFRRS